VHVQRPPVRAVKFTVDEQLPTVYMNESGYAQRVNPGGVRLSPGVTPSDLL